MGSQILERQRLDVLRRYKILDTPAEESFDRLTGLAAKLFAVPIALVSLVDDRRQWFKSHYGLSVGSTERESAFCAHSLTSKSVLVVPDATRDPRFQDNPLVLGEPYIRFYAGAPLITPDGYNLGTLCIIDRHPRSFDRQQEQLLATLAAIAIELLEHKRLLHQVQSLERTSKLLKTSLDHTQEGAVWLDSRGYIRHLNARACDWLGREVGTLVGKPIEYLAPALVSQRWSRLWHLSAQCQRKLSFKLHWLRSDGGAVPVAIRACYLPERGYLLLLASLAVREQEKDQRLLRRQRAETALEQRLILEKLIASLSIQFLNTSSAEVGNAIQGALAALGSFLKADRSYLYYLREKHRPELACEWRSQKNTPVAHYSMVDLSKEYPWTIHKLERFEEIHFPALAQLPAAAAIDRTHWQAAGVASAILVPTIQDGRLAGFVGFETLKTPRSWSSQTALLLRVVGDVFANALKQHRLAAQLTHQAHHDILTGLPNRQLLSQQLRLAIANARDHSQMVRAIAIDLDRFKLVNDSLGHRGGDRLLQTIAERLHSILQPEEFLARLGSDEFAIVTVGTTIEDIDRTIKRVQDALETKVVLYGQDIYLTASLGISWYPRDGKTGDALLEAADSALHAAKEEGQKYRYFDKSLASGSQGCLHLESELRRALESGQLRLYYQPQIDLSNGKTLGAEVLVRWQHPRRGVLSPAYFLPVAEKTHLISEIDAWVLRTACQQGRHWLQMGRKLLLSVNLSAGQLHSQAAVDRIVRQLQATGFPSQHLELEITETTLMRDIARVRSHLEYLKATVPGVQIAIDDFGVGYSSLNYLRTLPIDTLKIDRIFVKDLEEPTAANQARAIIKTIIDLAHNLQFQVVAEGIESEAQRQQLQELGCDRAQGYYFSRPLPVPDFDAWIDGSGDRERLSYPASAIGSGTI